VVICTIVNVTQSNYGKNPSKDDYIYLEYGPFLSNLPYNIDSRDEVTNWFNPDYTNWLNENPQTVYEFAHALVYTLPGRRQDFYSYPTFQETKIKVT